MCLIGYFCDVLVAYFVDLQQFCVGTICLPDCRLGLTFRFIRHQRQRSSCKIMGCQTRTPPPNVQNGGHHRKHMENGGKSELTDSAFPPSLLRDISTEMKGQFTACPHHDLHRVAHDLDPVHPTLCIKPRAKTPTIQNTYSEYPVTLL